jgi:hypothetical protein
MQISKLVGENKIINGVFIAISSIAVIFLIYLILGLFSLVIFSLFEVDNYIMGFIFNIILSIILIGIPVFISTFSIKRRQWNFLFGYVATYLILVLFPIIYFGRA